MLFVSNSSEDTLKLGEKLGRSLKGDEVICLIGDLGAGKTTFVKGVALGMGIDRGYQVRSPTFTIVNEYPTKKGKLIHVDLYRVKDIDLSEFVGQGVILIEWGEEVEFCKCKVKFEILDVDKRRIHLEGACFDGLI